MGKGLGRSQILFRPMPEQPLILTLKLDHESQAFFNQQRELYFPPGRNVLAAHLTLFHQLPDVPETHRYLSGQTIEVFSVKVTGLMRLGAGTAYQLGSAELHSLHRTLAAHFHDHLILQDRQPFRPHITIQNKVRPKAANTLWTDLQTDFKTFECRAVGLELWRYLNGPWEWQQSFDFI